jgi:hypothetical protein
LFVKKTKKTPKPNDGTFRFNVEFGNPFNHCKMMPVPLEYRWWCKSSSTFCQFYAIMSYSVNFHVETFSKLHINVDIRRIYHWKLTSAQWHSGPISFLLDRWGIFQLFSTLSRQCFCFLDFLYLSYVVHVLSMWILIYNLSLIPYN